MTKCPENVLINHLLLVIPMSYPCYYTNLCPHKPHKHAHTYTHTHTHTNTHTHVHTHVHTHTHLQERFRHSLSERESRFRWDSVLALHLFQERSIRKHFKMKRCSLVFNCDTNVLTHRIRHCCFLHNTFSTMNYDTAWLGGPLGQIAFSTQPNRSRQRSRQPHSGDLWLITLVQVNCHFHICLNNQNKRKNVPGSVTSALNKPGVKQ